MAAAGYGGPDPDLYQLLGVPPDAAAPGPPLWAGPYLAGEWDRPW